jgi:hypothetical protein
MRCFLFNSNTKSGPYSFRTRANATQVSVQSRRKRGRRNARHCRIDPMRTRFPFERSDRIQDDHEQRRDGEREQSPLLHMNTNTTNAESIYIYTHIYIYRYIYMYTHIYVYMHMHKTCLYTCMSKHTHTHTLHVHL